MLKWRFFENKAFWHTFAVLCISVFNISAGCSPYFWVPKVPKVPKVPLVFFTECGGWQRFMFMTEIWRRKKKRETIKGKEIFILYNIYVHVRNSVVDFVDFVDNSDNENLLKC